MEIQLINSVRKYEALYNPAFVHYNNYHIKMFLWKKVSRIANRGTHLCILTWNRLVYLFIDRFNATMDSFKSTGCHVKSDWCLYDHLHFLCEPLGLQRYFDEETSLSTDNGKWIYDDGIAKFHSNTILFFSTIDDLNEKCGNVNFTSVEKYLDALRQEENSPQLPLCEKMFKLFYSDEFDINQFLDGMRSIDEECEARIIIRTYNNCVIEPRPVYELLEEIKCSLAEVESDIKKEKRKRRLEKQRFLSGLNTLDSEGPLTFFEKVSSWLETGSIIPSNQHVSDLNREMENQYKSDESVDTVRYVLKNKKRRFSNSSRTTIRNFTRCLVNTNSTSLPSNKSDKRLTKVSTNLPVPKTNTVIPNASQESERKKIRKTLADRNKNKANLSPKSESSEDTANVPFTDPNEHMQNDRNETNSNQPTDSNKDNKESKKQLSSIDFEKYCSTYLIYAPGFPDLEPLVSNNEVSITPPIIRNILDNELADRFCTENPNICRKYDSQSVVIYKVKENVLEVVRDFEPPSEVMSVSAIEQKPAEVKSTYSDSALVQMIKSYPIIWDRSHNDHKSKELLKSTWEEIAKKFHDETPKNIKKHWLSIKAEFLTGMYGEGEDTTIPITTTNDSSDSDDSSRTIKNLNKPPLKSSDEKSSSTTTPKANAI